MGNVCFSLQVRKPDLLEQERAAFLEKARVELEGAEACLCPSDQQ
jgi:hypothetical protein